MQPDEAKAAALSRVAGALEALRRNDVQRFETLRRTVEGHVLTPYLEFGALTIGSRSPTVEQLKGFIDRYAGQVVTRRVRLLLVERYLAKRQWKSAIAAYRGGGDATLRCRIATAYWRLGRTDEAAKATIKLWRHGKSRPDACDEPFKLLASKGKLTTALLEERVKLAIRAGQPRLAAFVARKLEEGDRKVLAKWAQIRNRPSRVDELSVYSSSLIDTAARVLFERLMRKDDLKAAETWRNAKIAGKLPTDIKATIEGRIGLYLASEHRAEAVPWLNKIKDGLSSESVRSWRVSAALRSGEFDSARRAISRLTRKERSSVQWVYWLGRLEERSGATQAAQHAYKTAAQERDYYGFLAADRLGEPYKLNDEPFTGDSGAIAKQTALGVVQRAIALYQIGLQTEARREWFAYIRGKSRSELEIAAHIASAHQWHDMAILTVARAGKFDALDIRFPNPYPALMLRASNRYQVDPYWVLAVTRRESSFNAKARSPVGARGLMQIMPATGRGISKQLNAPLASTEALYRPALNIRFGTSYLATLSKQMGHHLVLATASYNAGPHRIKRWLPSERALEADIWIETIPFRETRAYVKRVLEYRAIYAIRDGKPASRLTAAMTAIPTELPDSSKR